MRPPWGWYLLLSIIAACIWADYQTGILTVWDWGYFADHAVRMFGLNVLACGVSHTSITYWIFGRFW